MSMNDEILDILEKDIKEVAAFQSTNHINENICPELDAGFARSATFNTVDEFFEIDWIKEYLGKAELADYGYREVLDENNRRRIEFLMGFRETIKKKYRVGPLKEHCLKDNDIFYYTIGYLYKPIEELALIGSIPDRKEGEGGIRILMSKDASAALDAYQNLIKNAPPFKHTKVHINERKDEVFNEVVRRCKAFIKRNVLDRLKNSGKN